MTSPYPYLPTNTSCVAHYTSINVLSSILKEEGVILWATRYGYFEDELEYIWPLSTIKPQLKDIANNLKQEYDPEHQVFPYILSFSNGIESPYMWRNYGDNGSGVMLVFDRIKLYEYCHDYTERTGKTRYCMDVLYSSTENLKATLESAYKNLQNCFTQENPVETFYDCPAYVKNKNRFVNEDEFRLTHCAYETFQITPETFNNPEVREEIPEHIKFRNSNGLLIPYVEIKLPKECLVAVCCGNKTTKLNENAIDMLLKSRKYNVGIFQSRIKL